MGFEIINKATNEVFISRTIINSFIVVILLSIFVFYVNSKLKKADPHKKPTGILNIIEILVGSLNNLVNTTMGYKFKSFAPYIGTLAMYLAVSNLFGLLGFKPPTADYSVPFSLAILTFILTQYHGVKSKGLGGYIKGFLEPVWFLFPLNVIGEIANPVSLSFRLFGNIISGVIIMTLIYGALGAITPIIVPVIAPVFHSYFDIFAGLIQTFIFMMLTMVFISMATD
ncbi:F0F1 ATP synthase subunit A [Sporosalibacterium faouarense]|uniref:F0F1 ATP synthase subunit A n=1 Tax=Sporosalibacterium faouarense TaxID=516123 RepID=UPI001FB01D32|nr:F0F1 ATP synthase subunit A [Sporosalibacterium faouarense]